MTGFQRRLDARLVLSVVAIGVMSFAGVVVETAMNIAFPALMTEFGVSTARVQWITTGYLLVLAAIMPISSLLNRRFRTRSLFLAAMALFVAGTVLCAAAPRFDLLIGGRLIQGVGTGIALPLMFNVVLKQAPLDRLGTMMGVATLITAIAPAVGPSLGGYLIGALGWPSTARVLRSRTLALRGRAFVGASRAMGAGDIHVLVTQILPNLAATIIVFTTISIPGRITAEAALSFLGVGVPPPTPSWGRSIGSAITWVSTDPWYLLFPGAALFLVTLAFNLFGDGLRDALDPRTGERR